MLTEHVSTIQKYLNRRHRDHRDIFVALQSFLTFVNVTRAQGCWFDRDSLGSRWIFSSALLDEMMGVLLQHFLNYHFIRQEHLIEWYERDNNRDIGYERARIWAIPTIQSFPRMESGEEQLMDDGYLKRKSCRRSRARSGDEPHQKRKPRRKLGKRRKTAAVSSWYGLHTDQSCKRRLLICCQMFETMLFRK